MTHVVVVGQDLLTHGSRCVMQLALAQCTLSGQQRPTQRTRFGTILGPSLSLQERAMQQQVANNMESMAKQYPTADTFNSREDLLAAYNAITSDVSSLKWVIEDSKVRLTFILRTRRVH